MDSPSSPFPLSFYFLKKVDYFSCSTFSGLDFADHWKFSNVCFHLSSMFLQISSWVYRLDVICLSDLFNLGRRGKIPLEVVFFIKKGYLFSFKKTLFYIAV